MPDSLYGGRRPQLLAVDDDNMNLMMISRAFKDEADVATAPSGPEAISWLASNEADLIMLDFRMPVMDGFDVLRVLKNNPKTADIPVIMLTGDISVELEAKGFIAGATDFVRKPFIPDVMRQRVRRVLRLPLVDFHRNDFQAA